VRGALFSIVAARVGTCERASERSGVQMCEGALKQALKLHAQGAGLEGSWCCRSLRDDAFWYTCLPTYPSPRAVASVMIPSGTPAYLPTPPPVP